MTRVGASQAFFNIVAQFQADKLIQDAKSRMIAVRAVVIDSFEALFKPLDDLTSQLEVVLNEVVNLGKEVAQATIEFEKFYGGNESIETMRHELTLLGETYGIVASQALDAGSRAAQVGNIIGNENIPMLVEQAQILSEISDLTAEEAMRGIISLNQQAGIAYGELTAAQMAGLSVGERTVLLNENLTHSLDVLNTVANRSVAMEGDLVKTMTNFSAQAKLAGDSFEYMSAMSAVLLEAGEEHGASGRALRMIYARLGGDINGATTKLEQMNITIRDAEGNMLPLQQILQDMKNKGWDNLTPAMKQNIAQTIAGNRHYVRFLKLMENFDRSVQLAEDGMLGLDSAQKQANKALEENVRLLEKQEVRLENVKAKLGEAAMPFQTAVVSKQADFAQATFNLIEGLGGLGDAMGGIYGSFKQAEGFIKFGLLIQSMSIGMGMFSSVTQQLNGLQVAVNNLHSKQASYLGYQQKMTKEQLLITQYMQYLQQKKNASVQVEGFLKNKLTMINHNNADLEKRALEKQKLFIEPLKERLTMLRAEADFKRRSMLLESAGGLQHYEKVRLRLEYEKKTGQELLATYRSIYQTKKTSEQAYMSQMVANYDIVGRLSDDEIAGIRAKREELENIHTSLQRINAVNEFINRTPDIMGKGAESRFSRMGAAQALGGRGSVEFKTVMTELDKFLGEADAKFQKMKERREAGHVVDVEKYQQAANSVNNLTELQGALANNTELTRNAHQGLNEMMSKNLALQMHTTRTIDVYEAAQNDLTFTTKTLAETEAQLTRERKLLKGHQHDLIRLEAELNRRKTESIPIEKELEDAINQTRQAIEEQASAVELLQNKGKALNKQQHDLMLQLKQDPQVVDKYNDSVQDARRVAGRFGMAAMNVSSILMGALTPAFEKTESKAALATMQMLMMSTNVIPAFYEVGKAGKEFLVAQKNMLAAAKAAGNLDKVMKTLKLTLVASGAVMVGLVAGMYLFQKHNQKIADNLQEQADAIQRINNNVNRLVTNGTLFSDQTAKAFDIDVNNISELKGNLDGIRDSIDKISNANIENLNDSLKEGSKETIRLLQLMEAFEMYGEEGLVGRFHDQEGWDSAINSLNEYYDGFGGIYRMGRQVQQLGGLAGVGDNLEDKSSLLASLMGEVEYSQSQLDGFMTSTNDIAGKQFSLIVEYIRQGNKLSEEQLNMIQNLYGDEIKKIFDNMDEFIITAEDAAYISKSWGEALGETGVDIYEMGEDLKNLTKEIYDFGNAREELFFGGKYGNVTGSLYKQVVQQGVGTLYHKNEVIMSNNFHGFFNEEEAASRIIAILDRELAKR